MDSGDVNFNFDTATGLVEVSLRPPLGIARHSLKIPATTILLLAAQITIKSIETQQKLAADLSRKPA